MKKSLISKIVYVVLIIIFLLGIAGLFFVPTLYNLFSDYSFNDQSISYKIAFYMCGLISLFIVYNMITIFKIINNDTPFKKSIEIALKIIAVSFMIIAIIVSIKTIFITTILSIAISVLTFVVSLCFYTLSIVFKTAIEYKNEIDSTI